MLELIVGCKFWTKEFHRDGSILDRVVSPVDLAHPARTKQRPKFVTSEHRAHAGIRTPRTH
jgi:hypothetical protein